MSYWKRVREALRHPLTRVGLGLFALGTAGVGLWPVAGSEFDPEKTLAFLAALCAWLYAELFSGGDAPNADVPAELVPHDRELAARISVTATDGFIRFLEEHDFGGSWRREWADPIYELTHFLGSAMAEFNDVELQDQLTKVRKSTEVLAKQLAVWGGPIKGSELFSMIPDRERELDEWSSSTDERVQQVNDQAGSVASELRSLFHLLRAKGANLLADAAAK